MSEVSATSIAKLGRNENVTTEVLLRICESLDCDIQDIMERIPIKHDETAKQEGRTKWQIKIQPILDLKNKYGMQPVYFAAIWMHQNIRTLFWD